MIFHFHKWQFVKIIKNFGEYGGTVAFYFCPKCGNLKYNYVEGA